MSQTAKDLALKAVNLLEEKKAADVVICDIRKISLIADYFIICSGQTAVQVKAIADFLVDKLDEHNYVLMRQEGYREGLWVLLDFGEVVIHIFQPEVRSFYNLERLWKNSSQIYPESNSSLTSMGFSEKE
ncbi:ribosome silencing factor [Candidatus Contubernalis alkaliaceticus]|uniref:ribosome silencing factor n=1 Tax=Candidatus Contubernalis alkaliaceticus TaxID=338645 RepID=UPI001F4BEAE9|nr:ribosome silencing factor [Candidatus Contubernalis alkalaceticus]UNC93325.1 ribosome silencing factor [Candidatus Contubernalis alkalaceticus]